MQWQTDAADGGESSRGLVEGGWTWRSQLKGGSQVEKRTGKATGKVAMSAQPKLVGGKGKMEAEGKRRSH